MDDNDYAERPQTKPARGKSSDNKKYLVPGLVILAALIIIGVLVAMALQKTAVKQYTSNTKVTEQYQKQVPELKKAVDKNGNDATARKNYAVALYATGDVQAAKDQYQKATEIDGKDGLAFNNLGNMQRELKDYDGAIASYKKAMELSPKSLNPYINLANIMLYNKNQPKEAIAIYQNGLKELPENEQLESLLATAYERDNNIDEAKKIYQQMLTRKPDSELAKSNLDRLNKAK